MKVAIVSHLFPTRTSPLHGIFVAEQARALRNAGADVVVLAPKWERDASAPDGLGLEVDYGSITWRNWVPSALNVLVAERRYRYWLVQRLEELRPDVIHAHYGFPDGVAAVRAGKKLGIPVVVTLHGSDVNRQMRRPVVGRAIAQPLEHASTVVCVGSAMRESLRGVDERLAKHAVVVANGYNDGEIGFVEGAERDTLLFVGSLTEVKSPVELIEAFARVAGQVPVRLALAGEGALRPRIEARIAELGLSGRVDVLGAVPHADLKALYGRAKALVLPSQSEGLPIAVLEALASGVPVIASRVGSIPEYVRPGENGELIDPGDSAGLADAMRSVLSRDWDHARLARTSGVRSWDGNATEMLAVYERVVRLARERRRLAYVCLQATTQGQASHAHVHEIIAGLEQRGWGVELFEPSYANAGLKPGLLGRMAEFARVLSAFRRGVTDFDVVYVRDHPFVTPAVKSADRSGRPVFLEVNGPYDELYISYPSTRALAPFVRGAFMSRASHARGIITVTSQLGQWLRRRGVRTGGAVVGNGADLQRFKPLPRESRDPRYALFFGALAKWQGIDTLMDAVASGRWPAGVELWVAGDGVDAPLVERAIAAGLPVKSLGVVPYDDMPDLIARCEVCVIPKSNVGDRDSTGLSPVKLYEAMACGVPVVVSDIAGLADTVDLDECGIVVPPSDGDALAAAVAEIASDAAYAKRLGDAGRRAAEQRYSWAARADATDHFITGALRSVDGHA